MALSEQIRDLTEFALAISHTEGEDISLEEVYQRWRQARHQQEDLLAVQEAHAEYQTGERGELAREELAEFRAERKTGKTA